MDAGAAACHPLGMQISLRQLEYAVAVAKHLNFSEAARSCFVSQPALSTQLQQLERSIGIKLFERQSRKILVTDAGRPFLERAERIVQDVKGLVESTKARKDPLTTELRLGLIPTVAPYVLPKLVAAVQENYPKLRLYLTEDTTENVLASLEAGDLDLVLLALDVELGRVETRSLFEDPFHVAMPPDHPLAERETIKAADLEGEEILLLGEGHCLSTHIMSACGGRERVASSTFRANSLSTLVQMVSTGAGITLIPQIAVASETACSPRLVVRKLDEPEAFRRVGLAWRPGAPREREYELFTALLQRQSFV
ncbi:MAG: LysR substrate-binding domain-containing protein [Planctomycetota bacterium]